MNTVKQYPLYLRTPEKIYKIYFVDNQKKFLVYKVQVIATKQIIYEIWRYRTYSTGGFRKPDDDDYATNYFIAYDARQAKDIINTFFKCYKLDGVFHNASF